MHPSAEKHWRAMRPLAMICATPAVLGEPKGFLEGVAATSHPAFIDEIGGSLEETQPYTEGRVVWDANIITSRGPGTALEWSLCCVEAIFGRAKALEVAGPMVTQPSSLPPKRPFEWRLRRRCPLSRVDRSRAKARDLSTRLCTSPPASPRIRRGWRGLSKCDHHLIRRPRRHLQDVLVV